MLFTGREVRIGKNCARTQDQGHSFPYADRPRQVFVPTKREKLKNEVIKVNIGLHT